MCVGMCVCVRLRVYACVFKSFSRSLTIGNCVIDITISLD